MDKKFSAQSTSPAMDKIQEVERRIRVLEERYRNMESRAKVTDQNMLNSHRKINKEIKSAHMEIQEVKKDLKDVRENLSLVINELKNAAKTDDVKTLEKYLDLWKPVEFVTRSQVKKIVEEMNEKAFKGIEK